MPSLRFGGRRLRFGNGRKDDKKLPLESNRKKVTASTDIAIRPHEDDNYYLKTTGNYFDINNDDDLSKLREKIRGYSVYNDTLSIAANLTAMFAAKDPVIQCEDQQNQEILQNFFNDQQFDVFLQDFTKEYIISGEATSIADWSDEYGCFQREQVLNPDGVRIEPSLYEDEDRIIIDVPDAMAAVIEDDENPEHDEFIANHKDIYDAYESGKGLNVDSDKVIRVVNKAHPWDYRGYPFFTPALSALAQEESLDAALYEQLSTLITPTIIGTVGLKAGELGPGSGPVIPTEAELDQIKESYRTMMMARFRLGVFSMAVHFENAFGNINIPDLSKDYDRCEKKILRCVSAGQGLLDGSSSGPFASNAINRDVYSSFLMSIRKSIVNAFQKRIDMAIKKLDIYMYRTDTDGKRKKVVTDDGKPVFERASLAFDNDIMKDSNTLLNTALQLRNSNVPMSNQTLADLSGLGINVIDELRKVKGESETEDKLDIGDAVAENNDNIDTSPVDDGSQGDIKSPLDKRNFE